MNFIYLILFILICFGFIFFFKKNKTFENENYPHQNFTTKNVVLPIGGYFLVIFYLIFNYQNLNESFIYIFLIFLIGALSDLKKFNSPKYRFLAQTLIVVCFIVHFDINISSTRLSFLDALIQNNYLNILFVSFCFLILINGTNFIDGLNGLVLGYYLSIIFILNLLGLNFGLFQIHLLINDIITILIILIILNILNKIYLGDGGSYLVGFLFAYYLISIYDQNPHISPFFIVLLLWYPCFENLFSILRKFKFKKSATEPDTKHFHQLLYFFVSKKINIKKKLVANNITSIIINIFNLLIFFIGSKYITKTNTQIILICFSLSTYLYFYFLLFNFRYKK